MQNKEIKYNAISGINGINGCIHYVELGGMKILLDGGMDTQNPQLTREKMDQIPGEPAAIFISHAHVDHIGLLPDLIKKFPSMHVFMTYPSFTLSELMLVHSLKLQIKKAQESKENIMPQYNFDDLDMLFYMIQSYEYKRPFTIDSSENPDTKFSFWDAGHIMGSAGILIEWEGKRIFYSGNLKLSAQTILKGATLPPKNVDLLFLEGTYGADDNLLKLTYSAERKRLANFISEKLKYNGKVLLPVFALGRTQELLMNISMMMRKSKIPVVPIYITGLGTKFTKLYDRLINKYDRKYPNIKLRPLANDLGRNKKLNGPAIILATSGMMMPNTFSHELAQQFMQDAKNGIAFVGYISPDSPGYLLRQKEIEVYQKKVGLSLPGCSVESFNFSAHSSSKELIKTVDELNPKKIVLFHGDNEALQSLKKKIKKKYCEIEVIIPVEGENMKLLI